MNCSRCQAELPISATHCPHCGLPVRQGQAVAFSYLPAGAPPWPTTVPQKLPFLPESADVQPAQGARTSQITKPSRSLRSVLIAVAVIVLVPILGSAFTLGMLYMKGDFPPSAKPTPRSSIPARTATPQPSQAQGDVLPTPTSFRKESVSDLNLSLQYPSDWQAEAPSKSTNGITVSIHPPQQQIPVDFQAERFADTLTASIKGPDDVNQNFISGVTSQYSGTNLQIVTPSDPQPTIGGTKWSEQDATFTTSNGAKIHIITFTVLHNKAYYNILVLTNNAIHAEAMKKYIQPMLDSLQFLS